MKKEREHFGLSLPSMVMDATNWIQKKSMNITNQKIFKNFNQKNHRKFTDN